MSDKRTLRGQVPAGLVRGFLPWPKCLDGATMDWQGKCTEMLQRAGRNV